MYSVRRFSTTLSLEEREYNIVSDLYRSGLGRTSKKVIGRIRRDLGAKIERSISNNFNEFNKSSKLADKLEVYPRPKGLVRKLSREANKRNTRVTSYISNNTELLTPEMFGKNNLDNILDFIKECKEKGDRENYLYAKRLYDELNKGRNLISLPNKKYGVDSLAHEIGHADNKISSNPIKRKIHKIAGRNLSILKPKNLDLNEKGLYNSFKNLVKGESVVLEESNASRKALDLLKRNGADKDILDRSKNSLDNSLNTYKKSRNIRFMYPIRNSVQISSRSKLVKGDYGFGNSRSASNITELKGRKR